MLEPGKRDQYPPIRKGEHSPLQAFLGPRRSGANTRVHFTQLLPGLFGGGIDIFGNGLRPRFFGTHDFILSTPPSGPAARRLASDWRSIYRCMTLRRKLP